METIYSTVKPTQYNIEETRIDSCLLDTDALTVVQKLKESGFTAYFVGGCIRDLLRGITPKDFDVSTSARPDQIKHVFGRQCLLIGRRFPLAHVRFGHKAIEVATFRAGEPDEANLIVRDNRWGSEEEDVLRRDFTINGLFYDPSTQTLISYVGGLEDLKANLLRSIGPAKVRFRQDPVRMLRLLKFRARYGFSIDGEAEEATLSMQRDIHKSSPARILEEILRMLESGASAPFFQLMGEYGFLSLLFPSLTHFLAKPEGREVFRYLACLDQVQKRKSGFLPDRSTAIACLLFPLLEKTLQIDWIAKGKTPHLGEVIFTISSLIQHTLLEAFSHFPRRLTAETSSILVNQYRLTPLSGKKFHKERLFQHRDFSAALQFLKIRALVQEDLVETYLALKQQYQHFLQHGKRSHARRH